MTIKLPASVVAFAAGNTDSIKLFEAFVDYWNHFQSDNGGKKHSYITVDQNTGKPISFAEKEAALNAALIREVSKRSGVDLTSMPLEQAQTHPMVAWAIGNIASQLIDAVLPDTMIESTGAYCEIRNQGWGESAVFDIRPRDLFPVTKVGHLGQREAEMHKGYEGQVTLTPEAHAVTVGVNLFRVLSGLESLAYFTAKAMKSIETEMTKDIYTVFAAAMVALDTTASTGLRVSGWSVKDATILSQKVSSFSGGATPLMLGTKVALANVVPDDPNYIYNVDSPFVTLGYLRTIAGINTFEIPQVADWTTPFSTYISNSYLWIVAPGTDKLVKCVIGGSTVSNVTGVFDRSDLSQTATLTKLWKVGICTSSVAAEIDL